MKRVLTALMFLFTYSNLALSSVPQRTELFSFFEKKLCKNKIEHITPKILWNSGITDSGIFISILHPEKKGALSAENLDLAAKIQMAKEKHRSFVYGKCSNRYAWIASFPSPAKIGDSSLLSILKKECKSYSIDSVPEGSVTTIKDIHTKKDSYSSASITCLPNKPHWIGPQEWFLVQGKRKDLIKNKVLASVPRNSSINILSVFNLVSKIRKEAGLSPLVLSKGVDEVAHRLARSGSLLHNRKRFRVLSKFAKENDPSLRKTAETRVIATNPKELANLIISSPTHRQMILDKNSNLLGVGTKTLGKKTLVVLITGLNKPIKTAKK